MMKCELTGRNFEVDDKMRAYIDDKIGGLEKYLPRQVRETASCAVILEDDPSGREDNRYVCEAVLSVRGVQLVSREGTVNVYAAVDIVEAKLRAQLAKYKDKHTLEPRRARMVPKWLGRRSAPAVDETEAPEPDTA
ncbi:MAG TPA: ribosome-associated translation inhibitor RaiA [Candidatus Saccharimonadia bacterium]|nr:ribosome-associated translation inhibitor RaiA [Candidatus Saccharimonadia bacterium]